MMFRSGILISEIEAGVLTDAASFLEKLEVSIKKVNNRKATSHIAVMSITVLFRCIFYFWHKFRKKSKLRNLFLLLNKSTIFIIVNCPLLIVNFLVPGSKCLRDAVTCFINGISQFVYSGCEVAV